MSIPKISIIVPVYNAQEYIGRCLESILVQTVNDWECVLVDDGSKDNSSKVCDNYGLLDKRFKVIHKKNGGVSSARQAGLEAASGEFVIHADSDDYLSPNMLEELISYQKTTEADLIIFDFIKVNGDYKEIIFQQPHSLESKQVLADIISGHIYASCWNKLVRRSVISKYGVSFPKDINLGEDKCFWVSLLKYPLIISYLPKPLYIYDTTINNNSLVRAITRDSISSGLRMVEYIEKQLNDDFREEINEVKIRLKLRAFKSGFFNKKEIKSLYKEVNGVIIKDVLLLKRHSIDDYALFFAVLGLPQCGHILSKMRS